LNAAQKISRRDSARLDLLRQSPELTGTGLLDKGFFRKGYCYGGNGFFHGFSILLLVNGKNLQGGFLY
jgi:hypothetical protein